MSCGKEATDGDLENGFGLDGTLVVTFSAEYFTIRAAINEKNNYSKYKKKYIILLSHLINIDYFFLKTKKKKVIYNMTL